MGPLLKKDKFKLMKTIIISALLIVSASGCSILPKEEGALKPPLVKPVKPNYELYKVKLGNISKTMKGNATFVSSHKENLFFFESGNRLKALLVSTGDHVKKGQVVAELETGELEARVQQQQLSLEKARIILQEQKKTNAGDDLAVRLKTIDVQSAQIQMDLLQNQLNKSKLLSPLDGVVSYTSDVQKGDMIGAYQPIITIQDPTQVHLIYEAGSSGDIVGVNQNMDVELTINNDKFKGKVVQTPSTAPIVSDKNIQDHISKTIVIKPETGDKSFELGQQAEFIIVLEHKENVLTIPKAGLRNFVGREYVQVLDGESRKEIDVEKGIVSPTDVEIRGGLKEGQQVILSDS
jgi:multidrug efflux pump subunit AcrA (membrane-fusion protein)